MSVLHYWNQNVLSAQLTADLSLLATNKDDLLDSTAV